MNLFEFNNYKITFSPQALALKQFKKLWDSDKTKNKDKAIKELSYVWYMTDLTSPYQGERNINARSTEVKKDLEIAASWKPTKNVLDAMEFYKKISKSMISMLYESAIEGLDVVQSTFKDSKGIVEKSDDKLRSAKAIIDSIKQVPIVMANLRRAEAELIKEQKEKFDSTDNLFEENFEQIL